MKLLKNKIIILLGLMLCLSGVASAQKLVSSTMPADTVLIGDHINWVVKLKAPKDKKVSIDTFANPLDGRIEILKNLSIDTLSKGKKSYDFEIKALMTAFDSGAYVIPERVIYFFKEGELVDTFLLKERVINVKSYQIDTATYELADIKKQFNYPITFKELAFWFGILLAILALAFLIYKMIKNHKENKSIFGKPIVVDPPHIVALRELDKIRNEKLWQNNKQKQHYTLVTDALRLYIEGRYSVQAMEKTSKEILDILKPCQIAENDYQDLEDLFSTADLVKFAKYQASVEENENSILQAVRFVNNTFIKEMEEDKKNG